MADAPKDDKKSNNNAPAASAPVTDATSDPAPQNQPTKASDRKGKSGEVVQDQVKAEQAVRSDGIPASTGLGTLLEPWQARDELAKALGDLEAIRDRLESQLSTHFDITTLSRHLQGAREWVAGELGLEVNEHGQLERSDGGNQLGSALTGETDEHEDATGTAKTPEGKNAGN